MFGISRGLKKLNVLVSYFCQPALGYYGILITISLLVGLIPLLQLSGILNRLRELLNDIKFRYFLAILAPIFLAFGLVLLTKLSVFTINWVLNQIEQEHTEIYIGLGAVLGAIITIIGSFITGLFNQKSELKKIEIEYDRQKRIEDTKRLEDKLQNLWEILVKLDYEIIAVIKYVNSIERNFENSYSQNNFQAVEFYISTLNKLSNLETNAVYFQDKNSSEVNNLVAIGDIFFPKIKERLIEYRGILSAIIISMSILENMGNREDFNTLTDQEYEKIKEDIKNHIANFKMNAKFLRDTYYQINEFVENEAERLRLRGE